MIHDLQNKFIHYERAMKLLNVRYERITWLIATGELSSKRDPQNKARKLVSLQDVYSSRDNSPHLLAPWIVYALVDPRDDAIR